MRKIFVHNSIFRLFAPPLYGISSYILILLVNDSISKLSENFFSVEVFLCIILSYFLSESLRLGIKLTEKICRNNNKPSYRILIQFSIGVSIALVLTTLVVYAYFVYLVGFSFKSSTRYLIVFNLIYVLAAILYHLVYFSIFYLYKLNESRIKQEEDIRNNLEFELQSYKNKINAELLYHSFETLIGLAYKDAMVADTFITKLSNVYRSILSNKKNELVTLDDELESVIYLIDILNYKYANGIYLDTSTLEQDRSKLIVPCTLIVLIDEIIRTTIISEYQHLTINTSVQNDILEIRYKRNNRLGISIASNTEITNLNKAYAYFSSKKLEVTEKDGYNYYHIPLFTMQSDDQ